MTLRLASFGVVMLCLCFTTSVKAQTPVVTNDGRNDNWSTGCIAFFNYDSPLFNDLECSTALVATPYRLNFYNKDAWFWNGRSIIFGDPGRIRFADTTTLTSATQNSHVWSSFALAFFTPYDVSAFTPTPTSSTSDPTSGITVTRIEATLPIAPHGCQTNTVIEVSNGTWSADLTLNQSYNDSGQLNLESPVSTKVTLKVKIPAHCSGGGVIPPAAANIVVQYAVTPATS